MKTKSNRQLLNLTLPYNIPKECSMFYGFLSRCFKLAEETNKNRVLTIDDWINIISSVINEKFEVPTCYIKAYYVDNKVIQKTGDEQIEIIDLIKLVQFAENFGILTFNTDDDRTIFGEMKPTYDVLIKTIKKMQYYLIKDILPIYIKDVKELEPINIALKDIRTILRQTYFFAFEKDIPTNIESIFVENIYEYLKNQVYILNTFKLSKEKNIESVQKIYIDVIAGYISLLIARWIVYTDYLKERNGY